MKKVTYLFGAGASANCLPIVKDIPERLSAFIKFFENNITVSTDVLVGEKRICDHEVDFIAEGKDLVEQVKKHQSIDTYAKKLRITAGQSDHLFKYKKLKAILSSFFIYEQLINQVDKRYDAFFASILGLSSRDFAENLRILSWNYDSQFEIAYSQYCTSKDLHELQCSLSVYPSGLTPESNIDKFSIFKLNGTTGFYNSKKRDNYHFYTALELTNIDEFIRGCISLYSHSLEPNPFIKPLLSFSWDNENSDLIDAAIETVRGTEVLVIVGYSIPFFNRTVDRKIMEMISARSPGPKIYIQDKDPLAVSEKLLSIWPAHREPKPILIDNVDQFFLPPEL